MQRPYAASALLNELGQALGRDDIPKAVPEDRPDLVRHALADQRAQNSSPAGALSRCSCSFAHFWPPYPDGFFIHLPIGFPVWAPVVGTERTRSRTVMVQGDCTVSHCPNSTCCR